MEPQIKPKTKIMFRRKVSKKGDRLVISIPKKLNLMVHYGKEYIVALEEVDEGKEGKEGE